MRKRDTNVEAPALSLYNFLAGVVFIASAVAGFAMALLSIFGVITENRVKFIVGGFVLAACFGVLSGFVIVTWLRIWRSKK